MRLFAPVTVVAFVPFLTVSVGVTPVTGDERPAQLRHAWMDLHPEYDVIFDQLQKSGGANVSILRWPNKRVLSQMPSDVMEPIRIECDLATLLCYLPHRLGALDAMSLAAPLLSDLTELDETLFGYNEECEVELWDSPSLMANLERLRGVNEVRKLTVFTKRGDTQFREALSKVKVSGDARLRAPAERDKKSGFIMGTVVDLNGKPVADATVMIKARDGEPIVGRWTNDEGLFFAVNIRKVPYRIEAFAPPSWLAPTGSKVASSKPVDAESGPKAVRLVIDRARLAPPPPSFLNIEDDENGNRIVFESSDGTFTY